MAALRIVLDGHRVTMGPPLGLPYLHVVILPRHKRPSYQRHYNAALSTSAWVWTWVRQAISPLGPSGHHNAGRRRRRAAALRGFAGFLLCTVELAVPFPLNTASAAAMEHEETAAGVSRGLPARHAAGAETPLGTYPPPPCYASLSVSVFLTDGR